ncbi:MAG: type IV toxin-antitoxin system AbiEi family antitoxin domain-containing protein [Bacilli bacterium]|jgi:predicted transcriptional regulator of viral defense system
MKNKETNPIIAGNIGNKNKIMALANLSNGYIRNNDLIDNGIPTIYLSRLVKEGTIRKVYKGVYLVNGCIEDELYTFQLRHKYIVYSKRSALYLNHLSNRMLDVIDVNIPKKYQIKSHSFRINRVSDTKYNIGRVALKTELGNEIMTYNIERCVCNIFIDDCYDNEEIKYAINAFFKLKYDPDKLLNYAKALGVEDKIRTILEVK